MNEKFKEKHGLLSKSMPWDFIDAFILFKENKQIPEHDHFSVQKDDAMDQQQSGSFRCWQYNVQ